MKIARLKIALADLKPLIWRHLEVPADTTLHGLHKCIQAAFGWSDSHLHAFDIDGAHFSPPDPESALKVLDSRKQPLGELEGKVEAFTYTYDFGDDWVHEIFIEAWPQAEPGINYPRCLGGQRACPPEDCGGQPGYEDLLEALGDPKHERHQELTGWLAEIYEGDSKGWQAELFDLAAVNAELKRLRLPKAKAGPGPWAKGVRKGSTPRRVVDEDAGDEIIKGMMADLEGVQMTPELEAIMNQVKKNQASLAKGRTKKK